MLQQCNWHEKGPDISPLPAHMGNSAESKLGKCCEAVRYSFIGSLCESRGRDIITLKTNKHLNKHRVVLKEELLLSIDHL